MTEFGMALIIGGLAFSASLIPVLGYLMNFGYSQPRPLPPQTKEYLFTRRRWKWCFIRDMVLSQCSLALYFWSLDTGTMSIPAVCLQLSLFFTYCALVYVQDKHFEKEYEVLTKP